MTATPSGATRSTSWTKVHVLVGLAVLVAVLEHDDAIALGLARVVRAIAHALGDPDAAVAVDVHVGRVAQHGRLGPQRDLEPVRHAEQLERHVRDGDGLHRLRYAAAPPARRGRRLLRRGSLLRHDRRQHQDERQDHRRGSCVGAWAGLYTATPFGRQRNELPRPGPRTRMRELPGRSHAGKPEKSRTPRLVALGAMICHRRHPRDHRTRAGAGVDSCRPANPAVPQGSTNSAAAHVTGARDESQAPARTSTGPPTTRSMRQTLSWPGTTAGSPSGLHRREGKGRTSGASRPIGPPPC